MRISDWSSDVCSSDLMSRLDAVSYISHGVGKGTAVPEQQRETKGAAEEEKKTQDSKGKKDSALEQFTVNLNEKAARGKVDPLIGRASEVDRTIQKIGRASCRERVRQYG